MADRSPHIARDRTKIERHSLEREPARLALKMEPLMMLTEPVQQFAVQLAQSCRGRCDLMPSGELRFRDKLGPLVHTQRARWLGVCRTHGRRLRWIDPISPNRSPVP